MRRHILRSLWSQDGVWHIVMEGKHFKSCCGRNFAPQGWTRKSFPRKDMCTKCWVAWEALNEEAPSTRWRESISEELAEYLKERMASAERLRLEGNRQQRQDIDDNFREGKEKELEAEGRLDELTRIWNKFCENVEDGSMR
jgi:hypothetical protein